MQNWKLSRGKLPLSDGAVALWIVALEKRPAGVLKRLVDGKYAQGNVGEIQTLPQRSVEKAIAAGEAAEIIASDQTQAQPVRPRTSQVMLLASSLTCPGTRLEEKSAGGL